MSGSPPVTLVRSVERRVKGVEPSTCRNAKPGHSWSPDAVAFIINTLSTTVPFVCRTVNIPEWQAGVCNCYWQIEAPVLMIL